jgi:hypothetical protein
MAMASCRMLMGSPGASCSARTNTRARGSTAARGIPIRRLRGLLVSGSPKGGNPKPPNQFGARTGYATRARTVPRKVSGTLARRGVPDGTRPWRTSRTGISPGTSLRGVQVPGTRRMACHVQYLARIAEGIYRSRISSAASASCEYRSDPSRADDAKAPHAGRARGVYPPQGHCRTSVRADQTRARLAALQSPWRQCCLRPRRPNPAWNHRDTGADEASNRDRNHGHLEIEDQLVSEERGHLKLAVEGITGAMGRRPLGW